MSVYSMLHQQQVDGQYSNFEKLAYHTALQNNKGSFSVNHLLDLGELPSENCAMFANTDPSPGLPTQTCTADSPPNQHNTHPHNTHSQTHGQSHAQQSHAQTHGQSHGQTDGHNQNLVTDMDMLGQQKMQQDPLMKEEPQGSPTQDHNSGEQSFFNILIFAKRIFIFNKNMFVCCFSLVK